MRNVRGMLLASVQLLLLFAGNAAARGAEPLLVALDSTADPMQQTLPAFLTDGPSWPMPPDPISPQLRATAVPAITPSQDGQIHASRTGPPPENGGPQPPKDITVPARRDDEYSNGDERPRMNVFWDNGAIMESADKAFRLHVGGRFDFDNTWYHQSDGLPFLLQDGADMRRARLRADGTIGKNVDFVTEANFANIQDVSNEDTSTQVGSVGLTDFFVTFKDLPVVGNVRLGHFQEPIGLEHLTSSNDWYYMEYSPGNDAFLNPFNYVDGVMAFNTYWDNRMTAAIALTRVGKQTMTPFAFGSGPGEYAGTGRLTCLPVYEDDGRRLWHLGIGYSYGGTDNNNFSAANRPLVRAGGGSSEIPNVIQTGSYYTPDPVQIVDAEVAAVLGRLSLSAEYQLARGTNVFGQLNNGVFSDPRGTVTYQAFYVETGFFLNPDDHRSYDKKEGTWGRQVTHSAGPGGQPCSPWLFDHTPVQLIARFSYLNLASGQPVVTSSSGTQAGWENDITAGVDWYINPDVHVIVNYVFTQLDYVNSTSGHVQGLGCRLHLDF